MKITDRLKLTVGGLSILASLGVVITQLAISRGQSDATVVNRTGIVRGATQRLYKKVLADAPLADANKVNAVIEANIDGLINGSDELKLPRATDPTYLGLMREIEAEWAEQKTLISNYRSGNASEAELLADSEAFFTLANDAVFAAEAVSSKHVNELRLVTVAIFLVNLAALAFVFKTILDASKQLQSTVNSVASASTEIAATVEQQERTMSQQASSVNETTTTMEELGASSRQAAEQAQTSAQGARQALNLAKDGSAAVNESVSSLQSLKDKVSAIAEQIVRLSEQTGQIAGISDSVGDLQPNQYAGPKRSRGSRARG